MGRGLSRQKNAMKKQFLNQAVKEIERLEKENHALKNDPETVIGQFIGQFRELYGQNSRLSVLAACLLQRLGGTSTVAVDEMESFKGHRINIKWELPEGVEKHEDAKEYIFSFETIKDQPKPAVTLEEIQPTETPAVEAQAADALAPGPEYNTEFAESIEGQKAEATNAGATEPAP